MDQVLKDLAYDDIWNAPAALAPEVVRAGRELADKRMKLAPAQRHHPGRSQRRVIDREADFRFRRVRGLVVCLDGFHELRPYRPPLDHTVLAQSYDLYGCTVLS